MKISGNLDSVTFGGTSGLNLGNPQEITNSLLILLGCEKGKTFEGLSINKRFFSFS